MVFVLSLCWWVYSFPASEKNSDEHVPCCGLAWVRCRIQVVTVLSILRGFPHLIFSCRLDLARDVAFFTRGWDVAVFSRRPRGSEAPAGAGKVRNSTNNERVLLYIALLSVTCTIGSDGRSSERGSVLYSWCAFWNVYSFPILWTVVHVLSFLQKNARETFSSKKTGRARLHKERDCPLYGIIWS